MVAPILRDVGAFAGHTRKHFQRQPLYRQWRHIILRSEFAIEPHSQPRQRTVVEVSKASGELQAPVRSIKPQGCHFNGKEPYPRAVDQIGMNRTTGHERQRAGLTNQDACAAVFFVVALQKKAEMGPLVRMPRHFEARRMRRLSQAETTRLADPKGIGPGTAFETT